MQNLNEALYRKLEDQIYNDCFAMTTISNHEWIGEDLHAHTECGKHYVFKNMKILKKTENQQPSFLFGEGNGHSERMEIINNMYR